MALNFYAYSNTKGNFLILKTQETTVNETRNRYILYIKLILTGVLSAAKIPVNLVSHHVMGDNEF